MSCMLNDHNIIIITTRMHTAVCILYQFQNSPHGAPIFVLGTTRVGELMSQILHSNLLMIEWYSALQMYVGSTKLSTGEAMSQINVCLVFCIFQYESLEKTLDRGQNINKIVAKSKLTT